MACEETPENKFDPEAYSRVVDQAELLKVILSKVEFDVQPRYYIAIGAEDQTPKLTRRFEENIDESAFYFHSDTGLAFCEFAWKISIAEKKKQLLRCAAVYRVVYKGLEACDESAVTAFVTRVGRFACFPYFRSLVAQLGWSSDAELPPLPVLRGPKPAKKADAAED